MYAKRENACANPKFNITFGSDCSPITYKHKRQMKTFFGRFFIHFDFLSNPAEGSGKKGGQRKRRAKNGAIQGIISPESVHLRSPYKKGDSSRYTPAP